MQWQRCFWKSWNHTEKKVISSYSCIFILKVLIIGNSYIWCFLSPLGCILDDERAKLYASVVNKGCAIRFAFAAAMFGESSEALFWLQLPQALKHLTNKLLNKPPLTGHVIESFRNVDETSIMSRITSKGKQAEKMGRDFMVSYFLFYHLTCLGIYNILFLLWELLLHLNLCRICQMILAF